MSLELEQYGHGFIDGVAGIYSEFLRDYSSKLYPDEYLHGWQDGYNSFIDAMSAARKRLNQPLASQVMNNG